MVSTFIYRHLHGNPDQQWFTIEVNLCNCTQSLCPKAQQEAQLLL